MGKPSDHIQGFECSAGHIAIAYGSEPCPLCASHASLDLERERVKQLTIIADARAKLNTCYRLGTQRGAGGALDRLRIAEGRLAQLDHDAHEEPCDKQS